MTDTVNVLNKFLQAESGVPGDNKLILGGSVEDGAGNSVKTTFLTVKMSDVSTASSVFVVSPVAGTITKYSSIIDGAIATGDDTVTMEINTVLVTDSTITVTQAGSAAGDVDSASPTATNVVAIGDAIEIITDGASTNTVAATFTVEIART